MPRSEEDLELIEMLHSDLAHIAGQTVAESKDDQLRRISVQLHQLLLEGHLHACWRLLGLPKAAIIPANKITNSFACTGSAEIFSQGVEVALGWGLDWSMSFTGEDARRFAKAGVEELKKMDPVTNAEMPLHEYLDSIAIFFRGQKVNRRQIIQYVALKRGGKHLDRKRRKDDEAFLAMDDILKTRTSDFVYGREGEEMTIKDPVYIELLAIGQHLAASPDIQKLRSICAEELKAAGRPV